MEIVTKIICLDTIAIIAILANNFKRQTKKNPTNTGSKKQPYWVTV
jgi:hypothetical protein